MLYDVRRLLYACCMLVAPAAPGLRTEGGKRCLGQAKRPDPPLALRVAGASSLAVVACRAMEGAN